MSELGRTVGDSVGGYMEKNSKYLVPGNTTQSWILSSLGLSHFHPLLQSLINLTPTLLQGGDRAQWCRTCLAGTKAWFNSQYKSKKKRKKEKKVKRRRLRLHWSFHLTSPDLPAAIGPCPLLPSSGPSLPSPNDILQELLEHSLVKLELAYFLISDSMCINWLNQLRTENLKQMSRSFPEPSWLLCTVPNP